MRVLITGVGGFVGSRLARRLVERGDRVVGTWIGVPPELPGLEAIEAALTMVMHPRDVVALHAVEPLGAIATMGDKRNRDAREAMAETLDSVREALDKAGHPEVGAAVRYGAAHEAISEYVTEHDFELVVMPTHRRTGVKRLLLGSVAEQVLRSVPVPMLMLRATEDED